MVVNFEERIKELCDRGDRLDAVTIAKANFQSSREVEVTVDDSSVVVETSHFRGVHPWTVAARDEPVIDRRGEYRYTDEGIELAFPTATLNRRAFERAQAAIDARLGRPAPQVVSDGGAIRTPAAPPTPGGESMTPVDAIATTSDPRSTFGRVRRWFGGMGP